MSSIYTPLRNISRYHSDATVSGYSTHIMLIFKNGGYQESDIVRVEEHVVEG